MSASVSKYHWGVADTAESTRRQLRTLQNTLNFYTKISPHYAFSSSHFSSLPQRHEPGRTFASGNVGMIDIPSIFYGGGMRKGSVNLQYYITGTLIGELKDENENGELIQVGPTGSRGSGSVAGVVLYKEGFIILTGTIDLDGAYDSTRTTDTLSTPARAEYTGGVGGPTWTSFAQTISGSGLPLPSSSYRLFFEGTEKIPTVTMLAHVDKGMMNYSDNPTFVKFNQNMTASVSDISYTEQNNLVVKNIVSSSFSSPTGSLEKVTYISKIGIYDKHRNLIAIAKLANPVRKRETDQYTFKLKLDV